MQGFNGRDAEGNRIIGLGISLPQYQRLLAGETKVIDLAVLGIPGVKLVVVAGRNDVEVMRQVQHGMTEKTQVHIDPSAIIKAQN